LDRVTRVGVLQSKRPHPRPHHPVVAADDLRPGGWVPPGGAGEELTHAQGRRAGVASRSGRGRWPGGGRHPAGRPVMAVVGIRELGGRNALGRVWRARPASDRYPPDPAASGVSGGRDQEGADPRAVPATGTAPRGPPGPRGLELIDPQAPDLGPPELGHVPDHRVPDHRYDLCPLDRPRTGAALAAPSVMAPGDRSAMASRAPRSS